MMLTQRTTTTSRILLIHLTLGAAVAVFGSTRRGNVADTFSAAVGIIKEKCQEDVMAIPEKVDLVIAWWTNTHQSRLKSVIKDASEQKAGQCAMPISPDEAFPQLRQGQQFRQRQWQKLQRKIANQAEIRYELRSMEQAGLMDYVQDIWVYIDQAVLEEFGAPAGLSYGSPRTAGGPKLGIMTTSEREQSLGHKLQYMSRAIHDRSANAKNYFVFFPDDDVFLREFDYKLFFDPKKKLPNMYSYGSYTEGECVGGSPVGSQHGPVVINRCVWDALVANLYEKLPDIQFDNICTYIHAMREAGFISSFVGYGSSSPVFSGHPFFLECHPNFGCAKPPTKDGGSVVRNCLVWALGVRDGGDWDTRSTILNIQGNGISDEYGPSQYSFNWHHWFDTTFPKRSMFECNEEEDPRFAAMNAVSKSIAIRG